MTSNIEHLKWKMAVNSAHSLEQFVALGEKRGYRASWAYRAYAARLDMSENFQRDMDRIRKSWDGFGKAVGKTAKRLQAERFKRDDGYQPRGSGDHSTPATGGKSVQIMVGQG
ncbi:MULTISPECIES: hypothetical protein [unclassified Sulfitobacter]|uniref:hypothetical protein n=1 Tax=unclassified Sulfitobacter TaxID=196795 RepID=UPI0004E3AB43|nr:MULTISPECIES: hypothetical protein [unclassified Sulfitobacter]PTA98895.1 hypothetical protein C8254_10520 [Sulfitobacter sp. CB-A]ULO18986.1 hypothetical protein IV89_001977 [Sulfitobacter sp. CB2047]